MVLKKKAPAAKTAAPLAVKTAKPPATSGRKAGDKMQFEAYCVKCKEKGVKVDGVVEAMKNGRLMAKGPHTFCGTNCCRILGKND